MPPIFENPFKKSSSTSRYLLPLWRLLSIPAQASSATDFTASLANLWGPHTGAAKPCVNSQKSNDAIYAKLLVKLTHEFGDELLGLFAYGSRVYGNAGPHSDVDVDVLIKSQRRCRRNIVIDGFEVEMFIHPQEHVESNLMNDNTGIILRCYAFGRIIYDPNNILPRLQTLAKERWNQGPPTFEAKDVWRPRYEIADLLRDLEDIDYRRNEETAHFLIVKLVERLVRIQERVCHRWPEKLKRCFENWETWDPYGGYLGRQALNATVKWSDRLEYARELALHVLEPIGGVMPTEWKRDWEEIPPANEPPIIPKIEVFISS